MEAEAGSEETVAAKLEWARRPEFQDATAGRTLSETFALAG